MTRLTLTIPTRLTVDVADIAEASAVYVQARRLSNEGASTFQHGVITDETGAIVGHVSYNGRVWADDPCRRDWKPGTQPIYDANGFYGDPQDLPRINGVPQFPKASA